MLKPSFPSGKALFPPASESRTPTTLGNADSKYRCEVTDYKKPKSI